MTVPGLKADQQKKSIGPAFCFIVSHVTDSIGQGWTGCGPKRNSAFSPVHRITGPLQCRFIFMRFHEPDKIFFDGYSRTCSRSAIPGMKCNFSV